MELIEFALGPPDPKAAISFIGSMLHMILTKIEGPSGPHALKNLRPEPKSWGLEPQAISISDYGSVGVNRISPKCFRALNFGFLQRAKLRPEIAEILRWLRIAILFISTFGLDALLAFYA